MRIFSINVFYIVSVANASLDLLSQASSSFASYARRSHSSILLNHHFLFVNVGDDDGDGDGDDDDDDDDDDGDDEG